MGQALVQKAYDWNICCIIFSGGRTDFPPTHLSLREYVYIDFFARSL